MSERNSNKAQDQVRLYSPTLHFRASFARGQCIMGICRGDMRYRTKRRLGVVDLLYTREEKQEKRVGMKGASVARLTSMLRDLR